MTRSDDDPRVPTVSIPDVRDYERINAELVQRLDGGHAHVRLVGAEGQRLLVAGLTGPWHALVEVEGRAGPELAAGLDAPGVTVVCRGGAADGAARGLRGGRVLVLGDAGSALAYAQEGGAVIAARGAGPRAGLNQRGGVLVLLGAVGRLAGERQSGGHVFALAGQVGPHAGRGRRGGRFVTLPGPGDLTGVAAEDASLFGSLMGELSPWLPRDDGPRA